MKARLVILGMLLCAGAQAQPAPPAPPAQAGQPPQQGYREPPANDAVGVDVDQFIGDPMKATPRLADDMIATRAILSPGDPNKPGPAGAVLRYRRQIDLGVMQPGEVTSTNQTADQQVIYIESGEGRIDDGKRYWNLYPGIALVIPPNVAHRFAATGNKPLNMLMLSYDRSKFPAMKALDGILVRDTAKVLYTERNVHWSNFSKYIFNDIGERVYIVYLTPRTMAGPHAHVAADEECWVKITDGPSFMQLGSAIRPWPLNVGLESPTTGQTVHAAINPGDTQEAWFYFAKPADAIRPPRPGTNPVIADSAIKATIAGKPLPPQ